MQIGRLSNLSTPVRFGNTFTSNIKTQEGNIHFVGMDFSTMRSVVAFKGPGRLEGEINGTNYLMESKEGSTTITVNPGANQIVYINGQLTSGNGPSSYKEYFNANKNAPSVKGPGL